MKDFEEKFHPEVKEKLFLVRKSLSSASKIGAYRLEANRCIAWVDCATDELHNERGSIRRMYRPGLFAGKSDFEEFGIYRIRVRENKTNPADHMIVKVIGKASDSRLDAVLEEFLKPVALKTELGIFDLDKDLNRYCGEVDYLGKKIPVYLEVDAGTTDAEAQLQRLKQILSDAGSYDAKVRQYIAADESHWEWLDDSGYSRDGFEQQLARDSLTIYANGEAEFWFDGGEPFGYHAIIVYVDQNDTCTDIELMG